MKFILFSILFISQNAFAQVNIIFDTDFGGDADDLGALVMLHHFVDKGDCNLMAVMSWSTEQYAVSAIDAVNGYYKHSDIPIGVRKEDSYYEEWNYCKPIADAFSFDKDYENAVESTLLYRQILAESSDNSITIVVVGPLKNIENLINSPSDSISKLSGKDLIAKKVKEFVIMGGQYPRGDWEWNFEGGMPGVTKNVIANIDVPIIFSGYELGVNIRTCEVFNNLDPKTPLYIGFMHFSQNAPWIKDRFAGRILDNASYDQTAVLFAVRNGVGEYWQKISDGVCVPDERGGNIWDTSKQGKHSYIKLIKPVEQIAIVIDSMMLGKF